MVQDMKNMDSQKETLSLQVYNRIKDGILSLEFPPHSCLQERVLAESLGVSRTPIREALKRLEYEGWFVSNVNGTIQVTNVSHKDVAELFQIRKMVEVEAVNSIFEKANTRSMVSALSDLIEDMKGFPDDYLQFTKTDLIFHASLIAATDNERLTKIWLNLHEEIIRCGMVAMTSDNRRDLVIEEHEQIIDSLWHKNKENCLNSLLYHHEMSRKALEEGLLKRKSSN